MRNACWAAIFASLVICPLTLQAIDKGPSPALSVYEIDPWIDGPVLGVAALGASVPVLLQSHIVHKRCPCDPEDVNWLDRHVIGNHSKAANWASHVTVTLAIATPLALDYKDLGWSQPFAEDFVVYAEVLAIDSSINNLFRYSYQRPRPEVYIQDPPPTDPGSFLSFDAGHVASTVAALSAASMTYGYRYGPHVWPWVVTGVVGVTEATLRTAAGKHYYTDDLLGLAVGTTVGTLVPMWHHRHGPASFTLVPENHGAELLWTKTF